MSTLIRPPAPKTGHAPIESVLELTHLRDIDPNLFTNTRPLWHPPGARGIYGGAVIAQCLAAAQRTVPDNFAVHSMHCYFVLAGNADMPVIYHVERVRTGKSFATRTVQARQRGSIIFTTTMSFTREDSAGQRKVEHAAKMPTVPGPAEVTVDLGADYRSPFESQRIDILNNDSQNIPEKRTRQWLRARGTISAEGGHQAHLSALAYMSDSYFIGTVARVHKLWRFGSRDKDKSGLDENLLRKLREMDVETLRRMQGMDDDVIAELKKLAANVEGRSEVNTVDRPEVGMMVSLDHTIYFHEPRAFRADEWMFTEMETPWAGDGRGLVLQKIFTKEGKLIATCVQEGVVRLKQANEKANL
ncbi:Thioesterase/thiol ester dehydrase-isomerase [Myriangium duriaei CBS 260.36]|uniref:Thioesterase/thiol ester dehydrase-isomerase n=1 Tax=Myriangium duriaei CBS 260.36 TaxID=1168546 RepID=A0A9P4IU59_9PEZI|nr:Thioesterase/thiol ester dehydrase-isomerase [Myriangium duriaei CBS 260.36]